MLIDFDHFSLDAGRKSEAAGWITELEARGEGIKDKGEGRNSGEGLWAKIRWSDLGEDAVTLSGVLQRSIDGPLLEAFFPGQPVMSYFEFSPGTSAESARVVDDVIQLSKAGYRVDAGELGEKLGYGIYEV